MISKIINKLKKQFNNFLFIDKLRFELRRKKLLRKPINVKSIALIYFVPKSNEVKYNKWEDGFTKAMDLLEKDFLVKRFNLEDGKPSVEELNQFDMVISKSCWNWIVDEYVKSLKGLKSLKGIVVSCSIAPTKKAAWKYDVVWYQTAWYKEYVNFHPNIYRAFGINSDIFYLAFGLEHPTKLTRYIDEGIYSKNILFVFQNFLLIFLIN